MNEDLGIIADYYLYGIELGLIAFEEAIAWADVVIEETDEPCGEIIDLALSRPRGRNGVLESLREIKGERNPQKSGGYLLGNIKKAFEAGSDIKYIAERAMSIASLARLPEDVYYEFDRIDDGIQLALSGTYGTLEQCHQELKEALSSYGSYPKT